MPDDITPAATALPQFAKGRVWTPEGFRPDTWHAIDAGDPLPASGAVVVPLGRWRREHREIDPAGALRVGVELSAGDEIDPAGDALHRLGIVVLPFPKFTDGRSYSSARRLREQWRYRCELRAKGDVLFDQLPLMLMCGFDSFAIDDASTIARLQHAPQQLPHRVRRRLPYVAGLDHPSEHAVFAIATANAGPGKGAASAALPPRG